MEKPKFSLAYTSARPAEIEGTVKKWLTRADDPSRVSFAVSVDAGDDAGLQAARKAVGEGRVAMNPGERNCVAGWNTAAKLLETLGLGEILIAVADDFEPPESWDTLLERCAPEGWWLRDCVVHVADGYNPDIFTLAILTTRRYRRIGYLFYPDYESLFSDTEHTFSAHMEKCVIQATHLTFEHRHPDCGKRGRDAIDLTHASQGRWQRGEMLFNHRRGLGFPVDINPPPDLNETALYVQAIQDDFCLYDVCRRIVDEGKKAGVPVARVYLMSPDQWWSGRPQTKEEYDQVLAAAGRLVTEGVRVSVVRQEVGPHRQFCRNRITVETSARNDALDRIYADGFNHVIIADGDELWMRGFYGRLVDAIRTTQAGGVYVGMVPVVGQPGYPVEGAKDRATVYVQRPCHLVDCRTVAGPRVDMPAPEVIHFTATRHSIEEVIRKHRDSGHYDDPDYDFEGWIKNTLPGIRPGSRNLHMYRKYQVWPLARAWRPEELDDLPASVLPYMGKDLPDPCP